MPDYSNKSVLVIDHGIFTCVAEKLAESFGKVYYYMPMTDAYPTSSKGMIGVGLKGVDAVYEMEDYLEKVDLIVYPDVYNGAQQEHLRSMGLNVWGSGRTDHFELDRWGTRSLLKGMGQPVADAELIEGLEALRLHLADADECYIKTSYYRGDFETFHHVKYDLTKPWLDNLAHILGPRQEVIQFIVEQPLDGVEVGYDGYHVGGVFAPIASYGYEIKDAGFIGQTSTHSELPEALQVTTEMLSDHLKDVSANISNEVRVGSNGKFYLIDPCMRCASPPTESLLEVFGNWDEVMYEGARGNLVELTPKAKYFAQVVITSVWVEKNWLPVYVPPSIEKYVKLRNKVIIDGQTYVSALGYPEFGSVVGMGDSLESAIKQCMINVEKVETLEMTYDHDVFEKAMDQIEEGKEYGIEW